MLNNPSNIGFALPGFRVFSPFSADASRGKAMPLVASKPEADVVPGSEKAGRAVNSRVVAALNSALEAQGAAPLSTLNPEDFTPQAVADRILGFIDTAMANARARGESDEKLQSMMQQAREGVEKGFAEAKEYLGNLGVLQGDVARGVDDTYGRVVKGLDDREAALLAPTQAAGSGYSLAYQAQSYDRRESYAFEVRTADGDVATVQVMRGFGASHSEGVAKSANAAAWMIEDSEYASVQVSYSVQGELDEGERKAIEDLLGQVNNVAETFFSGDVESAFDDALGLKFDTSELESFALDLQYVETRRAVAVYEQVADYTDQPSEPTAAALPVDTELSKYDAMRGFLESLDEMMEKLDRLSDKLDDPRGLGLGLLHDQLLADKRFDALAERAGKGVDELSNAITDLLRARHLVDESASDVEV